MIFYTIFSLVLSIAQSCPFSSYEEGLLPKDVQFSKITHLIPTLSDDGPFSFGYWILHRAPMKFVADSLLYSIMTILDSESFTIFNVGQIYMINEKSYHLYITATDLKKNSKNVIFKFPHNKYSGFQLFNMITFQNNFQTIILEITGQQRQEIILDAPLVKQSQTYTFQIGESNIGSTISGRLSKLIFFKNYIYQTDSFEIFQNLCRIPPAIVGEQSIALIQNDQIFQGDKFLQFSFMQYGRKYCVAGWAKYLTQNIALQNYQILLRISSNQNINQNKIYGDDLFKLATFIFKQQPSKSKLSVTIDNLCAYGQDVPICVIESSQQSMLSTFYFEFKKLSDQSFYDGLQQWHYFQYEYGRELNEQSQILFQIQFFNEIGYLQKSISDEIYQTTWINDFFYIYIGEKKNKYNYLQAQIFDLNFIHNYDQNKEFLLICHKTCKTCQGPFVNDCLSCYDFQNRTFIQETNQCLCKNGLSELEINSVDCSYVNEFFFTIAIQQIFIENQNQCQQGYFSISDNDQAFKCVQCPQQQTKSYSCFDCLVGSQSWSESLVCSKDLHSRSINKEDGFFLQDRSIQAIDLYFLDNQLNLVHLPGYQGYCNLNENYNNCFLIQAIKTINNVEKGGYCKPNYFQYKGECLIRDYECLQFNIEGDCVECQDSQYLRNQRCFDCSQKCLNCFYNENDQQLQCQKCQNQYGLLNGQCQKCGKNCQICEEEQSNIFNLTQLKCLKCIDDQEFFVSNDKINCQKNQIEDCKYIIQVKQTQLGGLFIPDSDQPNIMTTCALCKTSPIYNLATKQCINDPEIIKQNGLITWYGCIYVVSGFAEQCVVSLQNNFAQIFTENCNLFILNCAMCQQPYYSPESQRICLICDQGYFADRLSGLCQICPQDINCQDCGQQQKKSKDYWIYEIKPFIKTLIDIYDYTYLQNMQSQDISDYEIFCKLCKQGFSEVDGKCIPECPKSCLECQLINMKYQCVRCKKVENQIQLTIIDNQCIQCPHRCSLCRIRKINEIFAINPQFNDQEYFLNSYQCLQSIQNEKLFYDTEIGRYVQCDQNQLCSNEITINLNLICSETEYYEKLNTLTNNYFQQEFKQYNILINDLFSTTKSFQYFQNHVFYQYANLDAIKAIKIIIESSQQQICQVEPLAQLDQTFAEHIFSLKYVELQFHFNQLVEFQLQGDVQILNFHHIKFKNVIFTLINSNYYKRINFQSIYQQQIQFQNFSLNQQSINQIDSIVIIVSNVTKLEIVNLFIQNLFLNNQNDFFTVSQQSFKKQIIIKNVQFNNCRMINQNLFIFQIGIFDTFLFDNMSVISTFNNSKLIKINQENQLFNQDIENENIIISNIMLRLRVYNTKNLFEIESQQKVKILNLSISNSLIFNSTIIKLNKKIYLQNFELNYSELIFYSIIFFNFQESENVTLKMRNLQIESNQYDSSIHFIYFRKLTTEKLIIDIKNLTLINNVGAFFSSSFQDFEKSLIYIEAHQILIQNFFLLKGYGMCDIFIKEADNFTLLNSEIRQDDQFKFYGLHQYLDCVLRNLDKITYVDVLSIYSTKNTHIENMIIRNLQLINFPIIQYKSAEIEIKKQEEIFSMEAISIENNFLLQTDSIALISIILISSQQIMQISLNNINFQNNLFHSYQQNYLEKSSTLINIDSFQSQFSINQSIFKNNLVTNSTDSIIYINCQSIFINQCNFQLNSQFNYQILKPYIKWGFREQIVYLEQIELIFPINSETGNGLLVGQNIYISNTNIQESKGQQGGAFKILGQNNSILKIKNIMLKNLSTIFSQQMELGGAFNIDGSQTQTIKIFFDQIEGENIYCKNYGGFLYLKSSNQFVKIFIQNVKITNIQSQIGSLVYLDFTSLSNFQQSLIMSNITIINSQESFETYLSYFRIFLQEDINQIERNKTLIHSDFGTNLSFNHITVISLFEEGLFSIYGIQSIVIQNVNILNCIFLKTLIKIIPFEYLQQFVLIKDLNIRNITNFGDHYDYTCLQNLKETKPNEQICKVSQNEAPKNLDKYLFEYDIEKQFKVCLRSQQLNDLQVVSSALIAVNGLNDFSKIYFTRIFLQQIDCSNCEKGLIYIQFQSTYQQIFQTSFYEQIQITNSICGYEGCFNFEKQSTNSGSLMKKYLGGQNITQITEISIFDFFCNYNTATFGTCLVINNLKCILSSSKFNSNKAKSFGGAIYIVGEQLFIINNSQIFNNNAYIGGGLYFVQIHQINFFNFKNMIFNNSGEFYGNNYKVNPDGLFLYVSNDIPLVLETIISNSTLKIVQAGYYKGQNIILPSGQQLDSYQFFELSNRKYQNANIYFKIRAVQFDDSWSKQLDNSFCIIQSRQIIDTQDENQLKFTNNHTNIEKVNFDSVRQEYSFENLIIYFDSNAPPDNFLQLDFQCNSVIVPIYENSFPFKLLSHHQNYHLRVNIKTLPCQYGEIKNLTDQSCHICDAEQGFFSLNLNSSKCEIKDEISTLNIKSALLQLKPGFWRPYFDSNEIAYCYNFPDNCQGGWIEGDFSCQQGHIGALCEQCDVENIRGDGYYVFSEKFQCDSCRNQTKNITIIILTVIWTFFTLYFSVQSNFKMLDEFSKLKLTYQQKITFQLNQPKTGALIKMLTNYFQIIASLATFQLNFSVRIENFLNIAGNPIQTTANSQDCFLKDLFSIEIQYARTAWLIILPFLYIGTFLLLFMASFFLNLTKNFNKSMIITSILHTFIYFQPNMVGVLMKLLSFREISGYYWVKANVSARFDSLLHFKWMLEFALPILLVLALMIPFFFFYFLFQNKLHLDQKRVRQILGYLYHEYKPKAYFWEILKIFQKEFIIIFLNFYEENIVIKGILVLLTSYAYSLLNYKHKPFQSPSLNILDQASTNVCTISFGLAIGIYVAQQQNVAELQIPFWIILSYYNIVFLIEITYTIIIEYFQNFQKAIDNIIEIISTQFPYLLQFPWTQQYILKRIQSKSRNKKLIQKLKNYLLTIAKKTLNYKKTISNNYYSDQSSLVGENWKLGRVSEKQQFEQVKGELQNILIIQQNTKLYSNAQCSRTEINEGN